MQSTDPRTMCERARTLLKRHKAKTRSKSQRGELSELYDDGDDGEIKATGVKCKWRSQLPQTAMDEKESGKWAKTKGDNLVWFIQDLSMYLYRKKCLILAMVFYRNNAEGQGSGPLRDALCLLEVTRLKGMTP